MYMYMLMYILNVYAYTPQPVASFREDHFTNTSQSVNMYTCITCTYTYLCTYCIYVFMYMYMYIYCSRLPHSGRIPPMTRHRA